MSSVCSFESSEEDASEDFDVLNTNDQTSISSLELEDIQEVINGVKKTILETDVSSQARKDLVHRLIRLRIKKEDLENRKYFQLPGEQECLGHCMVPCDKISPARGVLFCGECGGTLWYLIQTVYTCKLCDHLVCVKCINKIRRRCVATFLTSLDGEDVPKYFDGSVLFSICPELSLAEQQFQCFECQQDFKQFSESRLCDYTGGYYCYQCHWGGLAASPARIIHNWDFTPQPMSQAALQYINLVSRKPLINLEKLNPSLTAVVQDVASVIKLRQKLIMMKKYLMVCRIAGEKKLLTLLQDRQHFVDSSEMFSLQDLIDINSGVLLSYLETKFSQFKSHIITCVLCIAKSFVCEICPGQEKECLFPFDERVEICFECEAVFHRDCFRSVASCPRCDRKREKKESAQASSVFTVDIE